jgi:hypothetical protein
VAFWQNYNVKDFIIFEVEVEVEAERLQVHNLNLSLNLNLADYRIDDL